MYIYITIMILIILILLTILLILILLASWRRPGRQLNSCNCIVPTIKQLYNYITTQVYLYTHTYLSIYLSISLSLYMYIYTHTSLSLYIYIYIYIYRRRPAAGDSTSNDKLGVSKTGFSETGSRVLLLTLSV